MQTWLILESGESFSGCSYGLFEKAGEVVFNTTHSGYQEVATDPSYCHQIVVMTAPMQGNYGVSSEDSESARVWIEGFVCLQVQDSNRDHSWIEYLNQNQVPILTQVDTRALTLRLRDGGTPWGAIVHAETLQHAKEKALQLISAKKRLSQDWVFEASRKEVAVIPGENLVGPRVVVIDFGAKENILRELKKMSRELVVVPSRTSVKEILSFKPDGVMLTNGPGNPTDVQVAIETVKELIGKIPLFGICMGHQILSLALGAQTYKMKFGHRGANHPIEDKLLGKIYVTSQNHGYAVDRLTLPSDIEVTHINLNDQTVAGFYSSERKLMGIQFHPEACPGPHEAQKLFNKFAEMML